MFEILLSSNNAHKLHEYRCMLEPFGIKVLSLKDKGIVDDADENGSTYFENSLIKAKSVGRFTDMPIIADDSGLEVVALGNFPGLHTARFAKDCGGNEFANPEIIKRLKKYDDKSANFMCVITLLNVDKEPVQFLGVCPGVILDKVYGEGGFGYDPIFFSNEANIAFGLASEEIKNRFSHRAKAVQQLVKYLQDTNRI
ncbi:MAG: RdgB/HAM1 family non-canonical purine NTP pyrophosphatase [Bacilli bacterium]|nr:RdgB/HAM1 family non-canonical purine NTP pyrophosphatase [Bacilli bacterium]